MRVDSINQIARVERVKDVQSVGETKNTATKDYEPISTFGQENTGVTKESVIEAIENANKKIEIYDTRLEFSIHEKTNEIMIKVIKNDEVIREIPQEKILDMVAKMMELAGIIVDEKA